MDERLQKQLDFILEIDKEKNIFRQTHLSGHGRRENDAEHAWHMAIMAYLLREYANEPVEIGRVMLMCLIHDIVEIEAGDTYAYDEAGLKTQKAREDAAKEKLYSLLPEDQKGELIALFDEFEANGPVCPRYGQPPAPAPQRQQRRGRLDRAPGHGGAGLQTAVKNSAGLPDTVRGVRRDHPKEYPGGPHQAL